jgi:hypothetical protein
MTKKEAREYVRRWRLVNKALDEELRRTPVTVKLQKLDAAYRMAVGLGFLQRMKAQKRKTENEVRRRWLHLKTAKP